MSKVTRAKVFNAAELWSELPVELRCKIRGGNNLCINVATVRCGSNSLSGLTLRKANWRYARAFWSLELPNHLDRFHRVTSGVIWCAESADSPICPVRLFLALCRLRSVQTPYTLTIFLHLFYRSCLSNTSAHHFPHVTFRPPPEI